MSRTTRKPVPNKAEPEFLSRSQVASLFGVSASTVTRWARLGLLRTVRTPGGHYRFPADETRRAAGRTAAGDLVRLD
ncbi:MAG TPA: helix-turn-helix domain-containing protein [Thermoanaerobaculia bacterium]|nr:helix-turn-helix domain-containing protein [Thermoanaerobaculia bacterium]